MSLSAVPVPVAAIGVILAPVLAAVALPPVEEWTSREKSAREKEVLGFYFSEHPLEHQADQQRQRRQPGRPDSTQKPN